MNGRHPSHLRHPMRTGLQSLVWHGWLAATLLIIVPPAVRAQGNGNGNGQGGGSGQCAPGEVCTQSVTPPGGDTSPPSITISPASGTTVYSPSLSVTAGFCDNASLNAASRTITFGNTSPPNTYSSGTRTGCGAYGSAQAPLTLPAGTSTLTASICDNAGNCASRSATYTYVSTADGTPPTVQISPGTQTTSTASFYPTVTFCDERKLGTVRSIVLNRQDVTQSWAYRQQAASTGCGAKATMTGPVRLRGVDTLTATVQDSAGNTGSRTVVYTYRPVADASPTNQWTVERTLGDAVVTYSMPAYRSLDQDRAVTLVYSSFAARPTIRLFVDVTDDSGDPAPVASLGLLWPTSGAMQRLPDGRTEIHYATGQGTSRLTAIIGASNMLTRSHQMTAVVTFQWDSVRVKEVTTPVRIVIVNDKDSDFGAGWGIPGVERVWPGEGGILVTHGDGTATFYPQYTSCDANRVCRFGHAPGVFGSMVYDSANARYVRTSRDGVKSWFDATGRITRVQDRLGNTQTYGWTNGKLTGITDPAGLTTTLAYDAAGKLAAITDPAGRTALFQVDAAGDLVSITDPDGVNALQAGYLSTHRVQWYVERGGLRWDVAYDVFGRMSSLQSPSFTAEGNQSFRLTTRVTSIEAAAEGDLDGGVSFSAPLPRVDPATLRASTTDAQGRVTRYALGAYGAPTRVEDPRGYVSTATYNAERQATSTIDPAGNQTTYTWSGGDLTRVAAPSGTVEYSYDVYGNLSGASGATPTVTNYVNIETGLLDSASVAGEKTRYTYDALGRVLTSTDPQEHVVTTVYNDTSAWKNTHSVTSGGRTVSYLYDAYGRVAAARDATGRETRYQYDVLNRTRFVTTPDNGVTEYAWGQVYLDHVTDARGQSYQWTRNALGWVEREVRPGDPPGINLTAVYDRYGRVATLYNRRNQPVSFTYDAWDRVATRTADGQTTTFAYSPDDPAHPTAPSWTAVANAESVDTVRYDAKGRMTDAITARPFAGGWRRYATQPHYNTAGQLTGVGIATPAGRDSLGYGYDAQTYRLQNFSDMALGITSVGYSGEGLPNQATLPNGVISTQQYSSTHMPQEIRYPYNVALDNAAGVRYRYDALNRIQTRSWAGGGSRREYAYDPAGGWLSGFTDWQATTSGRATCELSPDDGYVCDNSTATWSPTAAETFAYDRTGNPIDRGAVVGAGNRLAQFNGYTLTYDEDGNLATKTAPGFSQTFGWNALGQLAGVTTDGVTVRYFYDGLGQRVRRVANGVTTGYLYDGIDLLYELDGTGAIQAKYTYDPVTGKPHSVVRNGVTYYYATDTQGSVLALFNAAGQVTNQYRYRPFGESQAATGYVSNRIQFAGRELEAESGLYYNNARWYDPTLHRFLSQDPIGIDGGMNLYAYTGNDPVNFVDPTGLKEDPGCIGLLQFANPFLSTEYARALCAVGLAPLEVTALSTTSRSTDGERGQPPECERSANGWCRLEPNDNDEEWRAVGRQIHRIPRSPAFCAGARARLLEYYNFPGRSGIRFWIGKDYDHNPDGSITRTPSNLLSYTGARPGDGFVGFEKVEFFLRPSSVVPHEGIHIWLDVHPEVRDKLKDPELWIRSVERQCTIR